MTQSTASSVLERPAWPVPDTDPAATLRARVIAQFTADTAHHQLEVLLNQGPYLHLRVARPETVAHSFEVLGFPGGVMVKGDMGTQVFERYAVRGHLLGGFLRDTPNFDTWARWATGAEVTEFSRDALTFSIAAAVDEYILDELGVSPDGDPVPDHPQTDGLERATRLRSAVIEDLLDPWNLQDEGEARQCLDTFTSEGFDLEDAHERLTFTTYRYHFLWQCLALSKAARECPTLTTA